MLTGMTNVLPTPRPRSWPVLLLALPAFVAIWSGWVGLGGLTGFGVVHPLPGIADGVSLNTAITLPIGVETYAAYAIHVWLSGRVPERARRFARWSAIGSLAFGAAGQIAYHLMQAAGMARAPWQITTAVSCLPVAVLGMGAALAHLVRAADDAPPPPSVAQPTPVPAPVTIQPVAAPTPPPAPAEIDAEDDAAEEPVSAGQRVRQDDRTADDVTATILALRTAHPDWSRRRLAAAVGRSEAAVRRVLGPASAAPVSGPPATGEGAEGASRELAEVTG